MLTKNIAEMTAKIDLHREADLLVQGTYYDQDTGKGCFIGCLAHGSDPQVLADEYGIPLMLTRILERIFESLPKAEAADFFSAIPRAIGRDSKDLSLTPWAFLGETLRAMPEQEGDVKKAVDDVIAGMDLLAAGREWPEAAAEAAWAAAEARAAAAWAAAAAAARAAAWAARAAAAWAAEAAEAAEAWAAEAAEAWAEEITRQRDSILRLMAEAPVVAGAA